jgi:predicted Ser/Thr protein kinase
LQKVKKRAGIHARLAQKVLKGSISKKQRISILSPISMSNNTEQTRRKKKEISDSGEREEFNVNATVEEEINNMKNSDGTI